MSPHKNHERPFSRASFSLLGPFRKRRLIFLLTLLLTILALSLLTDLDSDTSQEAKADSDECSSCHGNIKTFTFRESVPREIPTDSTFDYELIIINHDGNDGNPHELRENRVVLELGGDGVVFADGENKAKAIPNVNEPGEVTVRWSLETTGEGNATIQVFINSTAHYDHNSNDNPDDYRYFKTGEKGTITVKSLPSLSLTTPLGWRRGQRKSSFW